MDSQKGNHFKRFMVKCGQLFMKIYTMLDNKRMYSFVDIVWSHWVLIYLDVQF